MIAFSNGFKYWSKCLSQEATGKTKPPLLEVKNLYSRDGKVNGVDFQIFPGEVLGIAGLMGSGRTGTEKPLRGKSAKGCVWKKYFPASRYFNAG